MSRPVVLVHGITASTHWWRPTVAALEQEHDVRVVRLPGLRYREAASRLGEWLDREGLEGAGVVGHSMGGTAALQLSADAPELVGRLALIAPAGIFTSQVRRSYVLPLARSVGSSPRRMALLARDALRVGPVRLWRIGGDLLNSDIAASLRSVTAPTLILWGENDRLLPPTLGSVFSEEIPRARFVVLPQCGHVPMLEAPNELNAELVRFLQEPTDEPG
jgi:pimeloyl-ACP methyl ester carboxylesterase